MKSKKFLFALGFILFILYYSNPDISLVSKHAYVSNYILMDWAAHFPEFEYQHEYIAEHGCCLWYLPYFKTCKCQQCCSRPSICEQTIPIYNGCYTRFVFSVISGCRSKLKCYRAVAILDSISVGLKHT